MNGFIYKFLKSRQGGGTPAPFSGTGSRSGFPMVQKCGIASLKRLSLLLLMAAPLVADAQFTFTTNNGALTITGYSGPGGAVVIPGATNGLAVTAIGTNTFKNHTSLTSVTIPDSVTNIWDDAFYFCINLTNTTLGNNVANIGSGAFQNCTGLAGITIPDSVTNLGGLVFYECTSLSYATIGNGITGIGSSMFYHCTNLTSVTIPDSVFNIGDDAFYLCSGLTNVTIPHSVTNLRTSAFQSCGSLMGVYFQGNAPTLDSGVFAGDTNATIYYLPGTSGWSSSFGFRPAVMLNPPNPAGSLKVTLAPGPTITNAMRWQVDGGLAQPSGGTVSGLSVGNHTVSFSTTNGWATPASQTVVISADSTTTSSAVYGPLTYITNNNAITITKCTNGAALVLPSAINGLPVTTIGTFAFQSISTLTNITIPDSVTNILSSAFQGCGLLTGVYFQGNAPGVDSSVFGGDPVTSYYLPGTSGWSSPFGGHPAVMLNPPSPAGSLKVTLSPAVAITNGMRWQVDGGLAQPSGATVLGLSVGNHTVTFSTTNSWATPASQSVVVNANSTTTAGGIYGPLTYITNNGAITITRCTNGGALVLPATINGLPVVTIGTFAFQGLSILTNLTIPSSVTNFGSSAFQSCGSLTGVYFQGNAPSLDFSVFGGDPVTLYYLPGTSGWSSPFGGRPAVMLNPPDLYGSLTVTLSPAAAVTNGMRWQVDGGLAQSSGATVLGLSVGNHTVSFTPLDDWAMPASQTVVISADATTAFSGIYGQLTYLTNNGVVTITKYTGAGNAIVIPGTIMGLPVVSISSEAFQYNLSLTAVMIPATVTNIDEAAFIGCSNLTSIAVDPANSFFSSANGVLFNKNQTTLVDFPPGLGGSYTIPPSVTVIGAAAFYSASLTSVTIPDSVTFIGRVAFFGCLNVTNISIGTNVDSIEDQAFQACTSLTSIRIPDNVTLIGGQVFCFCTNLVSVTIGTHLNDLFGDAFLDCPNLTGIFFAGDAPYTFGSLDSYDDTATVYYLPWTAGWPTPPTPFGGRPTALWLPQAQTRDASFGVRTNQFGFNITWAGDTVVVVEACTDLAHPVWTPVGTNTLTGGSSYFGDSQWTNYPVRFYRLRSP